MKVQDTTTTGGVIRYLGGGGDYTKSQPRGGGNQVGRRVESMKGGCKGGTRASDRILKSNSGKRVSGKLGSLPDSSRAVRRQGTALGLVKKRSGRKAPQGVSEHYSAQETKKGGTSIRIPTFASIIKRKESSVSARLSGTLRGASHARVTPTDAP